MSERLSSDSGISSPHGEELVGLTPLGKQLEILRIERGVSKQHLARYASTSRQQLWRVMTGKSDLTNGMRVRLASALGVQPTTLGTMSSVSEATSVRARPAAEAPTFARYVADMEAVAGTLRSLPADEGGRRLKRALLNAIEDASTDLERALPSGLSELRRQVLAGEL